MLRGLFWRRLSGTSPDRDATAAVKAIARTLVADRETELTVSEIVCLDPACPGTETIVLVMAQGRRSVAAKIALAAATITEQDVRSALVAAGIEVETE